MDVCYARDREAYRNLARVARFPALLSARQETSTKISPLLSYWKPPRGLLKAGYPWALRVEHDATDEAMGEQGDRCGNDRRPALSGSQPCFTAQAQGGRPASSAARPWSGEDGASGHPLMPASAIRQA